VERRLIQAARRFELEALLRALTSLGYPREATLFQSHWTRSSPASFIEALTLGRTPSGGPLAVITLNMGLLSVQSPLPTHFLRALEDGRVDEDKVEAFFHFFDHVLIARHIDAAQREALPRATAAQLLRVIGLSSPTGLHWLATRLFPELEVSVGRAPVARAVKTPELVLGEAILTEEAVLGGAASVPTGGLELTLIAEEVENPAGRAWAEIVAERLETLWLALADEDLSVRVRLVTPRPEGLVELGRSRLGFEAMMQAEEAEVVVVFEAAAR
jgi:hypothetical protein